MTRTPEELGHAVRELREARGLSQERLAAQAGVSKAAIGLLELGRFQKQPYTLPKIAEALGVTVATLTTEGAPEEYRGGDRRRRDRREANRSQDSDLIDRLISLPPDDLARALLRLPADKAELVLAAYHQFRAGQVGEPRAVNRRSR